ncbi:class I SAM-dependent methyltransferase [Streptomyces pactum]|uniref:class I SAM-dependent methyltransferase n=1 Tax=Streptomyces pactum TaxID=68249 RepID=UPI003559136D
MRQELVARQLDERIAAHHPVGRRLRVLDAGLGQGVQALRLARAGHEVTALEPDPAALAAARAAVAREPAGIQERIRLVQGDARDIGAHFPPGTFDVVLCHGVLMYVPEPAPVLAGLARVLAAGGLLSLVVRNADALALRPGLAGDWDAALAAFGSTTYTSRLGLPVRADRLTDLSAALTGVGAPLDRWYGVRLFTDPVADDRPPPAPEVLERLLAAEERAGRTDPYRAVAALLHLCGVRRS